MSQPLKNGAELLIDCLALQQVKYVFGIPEAKTGAAFANQAGLQLIKCRHEQNAAFMAGAVGRLTGVPGVCIAGSGSSASNLAAGLAAATINGYPLIGIGGAIERGLRYKRIHQSMDSVALFNPIAKACFEPLMFANIPEVVVNSFRIATTPRKGSVYISLPADVQDTATDMRPINPLVTQYEGGIPRRSLEEAVKILECSTLPVLLLGKGAASPKVAEAVRALLKHHPMPVVHTLQSSGVITEELLDCFVGRVGLFKNQPGDILLSKADVIITIGYDLHEYDPSLWNKEGRAKIIHIDEFPTDLDQYYHPALELVGDVVEALAIFTKSLCERPFEKPALVKELQEHFVGEKIIHPHLGEGIHPLEIVNHLNAIQGDIKVMTCDSGWIQTWLGSAFWVYDTGKLFLSDGEQALGMGLPSAIAAALVYPGQKIISLSEERGFLLGSMELGTAVKLKLPIIQVVWNRSSQDGDFALPNICAYAESFGAASLRIDKPEDILPALQKAMKSEGPVILDLKIS